MLFDISRLSGPPVAYRDTWAEQQQQHADVVAGAENRVLLLEHQSVYTAGRRTASWDRPPSEIEVVDVDRGGRITWHGPGQLIGYPLVKLAAPIDVVAYVRALEEALINTCLEFGVVTDRIEGRSGVWLLRDDAPAAKIAAIGVRVASGVTMHGFALNVSCDLSPFSLITPCGISDADVTTLSDEAGKPIAVGDVVAPLQRHLELALSPMCV